MFSSWDFNQEIASGFWELVTAPLQDWIGQYPLIQWLFIHPAWFLIFLVFLVFLLSGLLRAAAGLAEKLWIGLFKFPVWVVQWIGQGILLLLRRRPLSQAKPNLATPLNQQLATALARLELLQQEQTELLKEVKLLLTMNPQASEVEPSDPSKLN